MASQVCGWCETDFYKVCSRRKLAESAASRQTGAAPYIHSLLFAALYLLGRTGSGAGSDWQWAHVEVRNGNTNWGVCTVGFLADGAGEWR